MLAGQCVQLRMFFLFFFADKNVMYDRSDELLGVLLHLQ